jgi:PAS domain S-box-containing protein
VQAEREHLFTELDEERRRLQAVIETSPIAIVVFQNESKVNANRKAEELFGQRVVAEKGISQLLGIIAHPDGTPLQRDELPPVRALRGDTVSPTELLIRGASGVNRMVLAAASPVKDSTGRVIAAVAAAQDITAIKEYERLRDQWTSVIAHDLRQPITAISSYAELLMVTGSHPPAVKSKLTHIIESAQQMNRMIADMLEITRIEVHQLHLHRELTPVASFVHHAVERTAEFTAGYPIQLLLGPLLPRVCIDKGRIEQVLNNLLSNAAKYGEKGTPIEVTAVRDGDMVRFSVTNRGPGIAPSEIPHLFERFRRAAKDHGIKGLGLGLYITKGLVEAHGGKIWVESTQGGTTTFTFTLPKACP